MDERCEASRIGLGGIEIDERIPEGWLWFRSPRPQSPLQVAVDRAVDRAIRQRKLDPRARWALKPGPEPKPSGEPVTIPIAGFYVPPVPCPVLPCNLQDGHEGPHWMETVS